MHVDASTQLLFIGDSITQAWESDDTDPLLNMQSIWRKFYSARHPANLGFAGDTTSQVLYRIATGEADGLTPKAIVLLIGTNNSGRCGWSSQQTIPAIEKIVAVLRRKMPTAKILLLGILPKESSAATLQTDQTVNQMLISRYRNDENVHAILLDDLFLSEGKLNKDLFREPHFRPTQHAVHPTAISMARIADRIEPYLQAIFADGPKD